MKTMTKSQLISAAMSCCCIKWMPSKKIESPRYSYATKCVLAQNLLFEGEHPLSLKRKFYHCEIIPLNQSIALSDLLV